MADTDAKWTMTGRNIVIFCDGTGNEVEADRETNVVKLYRCAIKDPAQICYYHPGVGTISDFSFSAAKTMRLKADRLICMATGFGAEEVIEDAYRFLMQVYRTGDRLFLFGFSRGAFTIRALSGIIGYVGLLRRGLEPLVHYAQRIYFDAPPRRERQSDRKVERSRENRETAEKFKSMFSREVKVSFVGVWDTVQSIGLFNKRIPHDPTLKPHVECARHAVSIDETRTSYTPRLWICSPDVAPRLKQVWFAGVHSDVGGSYEKAGLSNVSLQWMAAEARERGLRLHEGALSAAEFRSDPYAPLHDETRSRWIWRLLGVAPRTIPENAVLHESVLQRMQVSDTHYAPSNLPLSFGVEPAKEAERRAAA